MSAEGPWADFRAQMPIADKWAYYDHAAVAPLSRPACEAISTWSASAATEGDVVWPDWQRRLEQTRTVAANLINADTTEIAFVPSTTAGISIVAEGYPWQVGDNVVTLANEFTSNLFPWMNLTGQGVETRRVPVEGGVPDLQRLADACDERTRIVTLSWVGYATGWRINLDDVAALAHAAGAHFFLDAIQGLGVFPVDVTQTKIDFLAADGHKWMLGPEGAGLFFMRREHLDLLRPLGVGWNSVVHRYDFGRSELQLRDAAARYEGGSSNMVGVQGLGASLELLVALGVGPRSSAVGQRVIEVTQLACDQLQRAGAELLTNRQPGHESGIVVFRVPDVDAEEIRRRSREAGVVLSCRGGGVRISPHAYHDPSDLDRLMAAIEGRGY